MHALFAQVNTTRTPDVPWFWWVGRDVVQKLAIIISARSPEGHVDRDVCQIDVVVKGAQPEVSFVLITLTVFVW